MFVELLMILAELQCVLGNQKNNDFIVIKDKRNEDLNMSNSKLPSARSKIECANWCVGSVCCKMATYIKSGDQNGSNFFMFSSNHGSLIDDENAVVIKKQQKIPALDCTDLRFAGHVADGVYTIKPDGMTEVNVVCDMTTQGGGWTVFQQRLNGGTNFNRMWLEYVDGFGDPTNNDDHWLGLNAIHHITTECPNEIYAKLVAADGTYNYARYSSFEVASSSDNYAVKVSGYSGTAGDSFSYHDGMQFSTNDNQHRHPDCLTWNCASDPQGGWWFKCCHLNNLNGFYYNSTDNGNDNYGMLWILNLGNSNSLMHTTLMIRRK